MTLLLVIISLTINIINMRMRIRQIQSTKLKEFTTATILTEVTAKVNFVTKCVTTKRITSDFPGEQAVGRGVRQPL